MNIDQFFEDTKGIELYVGENIEKKTNSNLLDNEALFQLPLLCLIVLTLSKSRVKPDVSAIGQLVGECLEATIPTFKGSAQHLGWSANLRVRTVKAVTFLEQVDLVKICERTSKVSATIKGAKVIDKAISLEDDLSASLLCIQREYRNIYTNNRLDLEVGSETKWEME